MTSAAIGLALVAILAFYMHWLLYPALAAFPRLWEKLGAAVLTLYILAVLLGMGVGLGLVIIWSYDRLA